MSSQRHDHVPPPPPSKRRLLECRLASPLLPRRRRPPLLPSNRRRRRHDRDRRRHQTPRFTQLPTTTLSNRMTRTTNVPAASSPSILNDHDIVIARRPLVVCLSWARRRFWCNKSVFVLMLIFVSVARGRQLPLLNRLCRARFLLSSSSRRLIVESTRTLALSSKKVASASPSHRHFKGSSHALELVALTKRTKMRVPLAKNAKRDGHQSCSSPQSAVCFLCACVSGR